MKPHRCPDCTRYGKVLYRAIRLTHPAWIRAFRYYECIYCKARWRSFEQFQRRLTARRPKKHPKKLTTRLAIHA